MKYHKKRYIVTTNNNNYEADAVIIACGGKAAPKQGGSGDGLKLAEMLGHRVTDIHPALVAIKSEKTSLNSLKGIRAICNITLKSDKIPIKTEHGELQFTNFGLSGIPAMQLSSLLYDIKGTITLSVDLIPDFTEEELYRLLLSRRNVSPRETLETAFIGLVHKNIIYAILKENNCSPLSRPIETLSPNQIKSVAHSLKNWEFPVSGTLDWEYAQVTRGGVSLSEVRKDFSSKIIEGLYFAGEILDISGDCGGYNLHWCWNSGITSGKSAAGYLAK